jgi:stearoyl-CoA desaturase (Delta-9 desaturase)
VSASLLIFREVKSMAESAYDGVAAFPGTEPSTRPRVQRLIQISVTGLIVFGPFAGLGVAIWSQWGRGLGALDLSLAVFFYLVTGFGVTAGFHRCFTHRGFTARPALRAVLAVAGSMSFQGEAIGWVAIHRRHHAFTDQPGDPHSPYRYGTGPLGQLRGVAHAHLGWLFGDEYTSPERYAPDLLADATMRRISRAFPLLCAASLILPALAGWAISGGSMAAAWSALLWAGLVRVLLLQHVTWSVNSLCHLLGNRPYATRRHDRATNLWPLALLSLGESWHNTHHSDPACARHGVDRGQIDPTAALIRVFERLGWAREVRWPVAARLDAHRIRSSGARIAVKARTGMAE